jgi:hypothetical protein
LYPGVYVRSDAWRGLDSASQHRLRVKAAAAKLGADTVFSHRSAAAMWNLPRVGEPWPDQVHVLAASADGGRSNAMVARHTVGVPEVVQDIDGVLVTSLARTIVDLAATVPFTQAVVFADAALHRTLHPVRGVPRTSLLLDDLIAAQVSLPMRHGAARARKVINFASPAADGPGESLSRVSMLVSGIPAPVLQQPLQGASGKLWTVDFFWPAFNLIGEFDGEVKYTDPVLLRGRSPSHVLFEEKRREDDLRAAGYRMSRWTWATAVSPNLLRTHLQLAGVR